MASQYESFPWSCTDALSALAPSQGQGSALVLPHDNSRESNPCRMNSELPKHQGSHFQGRRWRFPNESFETATLRKAASCHTAGTAGKHLDKEQLTNLCPFANLRIRQPCKAVTARNARSRASHIRARGGTTFSSKAPVARGRQVPSPHDCRSLCTESGCLKVSPRALNHGRRPRPARVLLNDLGRTSLHRSLKACHGQRRCVPTSAQQRSSIRLGFGD